jgi:hypothetical protein
MSPSHPPVGREWTEKGQLPSCDVGWAIDDFAPKRSSAPLRFIGPLNPNAPLTDPLVSYQTAPSPDNDA